MVSGYAPHRASHHSAHTDDRRGDEHAESAKVGGMVRHRSKSTLSFSPSFSSPIVSCSYEPRLSISFECGSNGGALARRGALRSRSSEVAVPVRSPTVRLAQPDDRLGSEPHRQARYAAALVCAQPSSAAVQTVHWCAQFGDKRNSRGAAVQPSLFLRPRRRSESPDLNTSS